MGYLDREAASGLSHERLRQAQYYYATALGYEAQFFAQALEEVDVVVKTKELLNGTLSKSDEKHLEHEIEEVKKLKKQEPEEAALASRSWLLILGSLVVCGGIGAVVAMRSRNEKRSISG